ncbi:hypothetical protein [Chromobacterium aquaticum]|uniref:Type VI secretion protein n=1 Tax=Chromobacterium aquaticum TaxID=467180 RepID=A0ABV8ZWF6_9NEIS|nr:hypothetical protein [Chromobacterium aquaticum]MCD5360609.1 hypothetical protein [Chromobacterium aquaticum]
MAWPFPQLTRPDWPPPPSHGRWLAMLAGAFIIGMVATSLLWPRGQLMDWRFWGWALLIPGLSWLMLWGGRYYLFETEREEVQAERQAQDELMRGWEQWARAALPVLAASVRLARPLSLEQRLAGNGPQYAGQALSLPPVLDPGPLPEWLAVEPERRERVLRLQALLLEVLTPELMARLAALGNGDLVLMAREEDEALWRLVCRQQLSGGGEERWREPLAERAGMLTPEQGWQAIYDQVYQQERRRPVLLLGALLHGADDMAPDGSEHGFALLLGGSDDGARPIRHLSRSQPTSAAEWSEDLAQLMRVQGDAKPPDCVWHSGLGQEELQGLGQALSARLPDWFQRERVPLESLEDALGLAGDLSYPLHLAILCQPDMPEEQWLAWKDAAGCRLQRVSAAPKGEALTPAPRTAAASSSV